MSSIASVSPQTCFTSLCASQQFFKEANDTYSNLQKEHESVRKKFICDKNTTLEDLLELLRALEVLMISEHLHISTFYCVLHCISVIKLQNYYSLLLLISLLLICFLISRGRRRGFRKTRGRFNIWLQSRRTLWDWNPETPKRRAAPPSSSKPCVTSDKTRSVVSSWRHTMDSVFQKCYWRVSYRNAMSVC